jgi:hypothetical protein
MKLVVIARHKIIKKFPKSEIKLLGNFLFEINFIINILPVKRF